MTNVESTNGRAFSPRFSLAQPPGRWPGHLPSPSAWRAGIGPPRWGSSGLTLERIRKKLVFTRLCVHRALCGYLFSRNTLDRTPTSSRPVHCVGYIWPRLNFFGQPLVWYLSAGAWERGRSKKIYRRNPSWPTALTENPSIT